MSIARRVVAEGLGTALLLVAVVGSGIMGERLAGGNVAVALLANSVATGAALVALILALGPVSGAHFNPVVSVVEWASGKLPASVAVGYSVAQVVGALVGVVVAHLMFDLPVLFASQHAREGFGQLLGEVVATFGLLTVILRCAASRPEAVAYAVGAYITAAYWFTSSTSFANPAVTIARAFTDTFSGIRPSDVPAFVIAQGIGATGAFALHRFLSRKAVVAAEERKVPDSASRVETKTRP